MLYHKIQTLFKRTEQGEMILGDWTDPVFEYLAGLKWRLTEKINGTNIRIVIDPATENPFGPTKVTFGGRTETAQLSAKLVQWLTEKFQNLPMLETLAKKFPDGGILYGEGFGAGIQKGGGNYQGRQSFILFDVNVGGWWLQPEAVLDVAQTLELDMVPELGQYTLYEAIDMVQKGIKSRFGPFEAEGVVAVPLVQLFNRKGERIIVKLKTKDWERAVPKDSEQAGWDSPEQCEKEIGHGL